MLIPVILRIRSGVEILRKVINVARLLVIFSFVGIGIRFVLEYREQAAKLRKSDNQAEHHDTSFQEDSSR